MKSEPPQENDAPSLSPPESVSADTTAEGQANQEGIATSVDAELLADLADVELNIEPASGGGSDFLPQAAWGRFRPSRFEYDTDNDSALDVNPLAFSAWLEALLSSSSLVGEIRSAYVRFGSSSDALDEFVAESGSGHASASSGGTTSFDAADTAPADMILEPLVLVGTDAADVLSGGSADDTLTGGKGADVLFGDEGADILYGDLGGPLSAAAGADTLDGGGGDDILYGEQGRDELFGGDGNDRLYGSFDNDILHGGNGDDYLNGGHANDVLYGGDGADILQGSYGFDRLFGEAGNDTLYGYRDATYLDGGSGDDQLYGTTSSDSLLGGAGNDIMIGGTGDDSYFFGADSVGNTDVIVDTGGFDTLRFNGTDPRETVSLVMKSGSDLVFQYDGGGSLTMSGFYSGNAIEKLAVGGDTYAINPDFVGSASFADFLASTDVMYLDGTDTADVLTGDSGDDRINGLGGNDVLSGGDGADLIFGGTGSDTVNGDGGDDTLYGDVNGATSSPGADTLNGGDGNDTLYGERGRDILHGDAGDDRLWGGHDNDIVYGDAGQDLLYGGHANDVLYGGDDADVLYGEFGYDALHGGAGDDKLEGGWNNDVLTGDGGADEFWIVKWTGRDTVTDFNESEGDKINVQALGVSDLSGASVTDDGAGNTLVVFGTYEQMVLNGVNASTIGADDFIF